ncbi:MAG: IS701 family transposase, partial [Blastocatellia bacterium]
MGWIGREAHHERGPRIYGVKEAYDYVNRCPSLFRTVVTAVVSNRELVDGLAVEVQQPDFAEEEMEYLVMTSQESYTQMEQVRKRIVELLSYRRNRQAYRKRTEMAVEIVREIEDEGHFPEANYAFDNGVLTLDLTRLIEERDKHWVSEIECSRHINWQGQWRRVDGVWEELRTKHPESFRPIKAKGRNGEERQYW